MYIYSTNLLSRIDAELRNFMITVDTLTPQELNKARATDEMQKFRHAWLYK